MGLVIDAKERFAKRTALWMIHGRLGKNEALERLQLFPKEHIQTIGRLARKLRGLPPREEDVPPPSSGA